MASRKPVDSQRPKVILPDLPRRLFPDQDQDEPERARGNGALAASHAPHARVERMPPRQPTARVRSARSLERLPPRAQREIIVLPTPRQIAGQTVPSLIMALSLGVVAYGARMLSPFGLPIWLVPLLGPTLLLFLAANRVIHPFWRNAALANIATVACILPVLAIRRFTIAVPSFAQGHGVLLAPIVTTIAAALAIGILAIGIAFTTREDPEFAGLLLLPSCLIVPMCVGMSMQLTFSTWLAATAAIFVGTGLATVVASLLPGTLAALVAPGAIALEFLFLALVERTRVFPRAAGLTSVLLFWGLLVVVVVLAVLLPVLSEWIGRIDRRARALEYATS